MLFRSGKGSLAAWLVAHGHLEPGVWERWAKLSGDAPELPGYELLKRLGEGGTAVVFLARRASGLEVALKVARPEVAADPAARENFVQEGLLLGRLRHPGIVRARKLARAGQTLYLELDHLPGETALDRILAGRLFGEQEALGVALQVARALEYLAGQGVVHRDVKPGNIMLGPRGEATLLDLGFAASAAGRESGREDTGGTLHYMAPEQALGEEVDQRADIYALGLSLFHMVTGALPGNRSDPRQAMRERIRHQLSSLALKERAFTPLLAYFVQKMTAREREIRYQDHAELIRDLEEKCAGFKEIREEGRVERRPPLRRRRRRRS